MRRFRITVLADNGYRSPADLGTEVVDAATRGAAQRIAYDRLWDHRLDAVDCSPRFLTTRLGSVRRRPGIHQKVQRVPVPAR